MRRFLVFGLALVLVAGLLVAGVVVWKRLNRTPLEEALHAVPAASERVSFTDWSVVRQQVDVGLGSKPSDARISNFIEKAYDRDFTAASSIDSAAVAMNDKFGFGPANAQWEAYAQGDKGATMVVKVADGADFDVLAGNLRSDGYTKPKDDDGVWQGGEDLVAQLDPTLTPGGAVRRAARRPGARGDQRQRRLRGQRGQGREGRRRLGRLEGRRRRHGRPAGRAGQRDAVDRRLRLRGPRDVAGRPGRPGPRPSSWSARPGA